MATQHVLPLNDLIAHQLDKSCICGPRVVRVEPPTTDDVKWLVVHHSLDGRERKV